jgi:hypothetical protein
MTAVAHRRPAAIIEAFAPADPPMPRAVAHAVARAIEPVIGRGQNGRDDPGHYVAPQPVSDADWRAAQVAADRFEALLAPMTPDVLGAWLLPVNAASRNPQAPAEFAMRVSGLAEMLGDMPAAAFTSEARRALRTGFFPSHEDIRAAVAPVAEAWRRKRDALRNLPRIGREAPARVMPNDDERATMAARALLVAQELRSSGSDLSRPRPRASYLSGEALRAARERAGIVVNTDA